MSHVETVQHIDQALRRVDVPTILECLAENVETNLLASAQQVVAIIGIDARVRSSGKPLHDLELHLWPFGASGEVESFRHVADTHQHWLARRA